MSTPPAPNDPTDSPAAPSAAAPLPQPEPLAPALAGSLVFFASGSVLVLEILAVRILAPYVGVTLETYTAIIGIVLAGIAFGTWFGGRLADLLDPRATLGPVLVVGGVLAVATLPIVRGLGGLALDSPGAGSIVVLSIFGFFPPAAVLSAVSPTVVKLQLESLHETGAVVGRLSALGTAGALAGTFLTGFVLVAQLATTPIVIALGAVLVAVGVVLGVVLRRGSGRRTAASGAPFVALLLLLTVTGAAVAAGDRCEVESAYYCARVEVDPERAGGRLLLLDTLRHSYVDVDDPAYLEFDYAKAIGDVAATFRPRGEAIEALHVGGGGFSLPRHLAAARPGTRSLVLELDPGLVELARRRLRLREGPDLRVRTGDARTALARLPDGAFDLVVGDAFGGVAVPWHLTTLETVRELRRVLGPRGIYAVNVIDHPPSRFARAEARTLAATFRHVALVAPNPETSGSRGGNFVLVASDAPLPVAAVRERVAPRGGAARVVVGADFTRFASGVPVLRDEYAPVDQLLTPFPEQPG